MALPMSDAEIASEYRQAKKKQSQIHILADLNGTDTKTIVEILTREGCELPGNFKKKTTPELNAAAAAQKAHPSTVLNSNMVRLAALDTIQDMMPGDHCDEDDALWFLERLRGIFALLDMMEAQNGKQ